MRNLNAVDMLNVWEDGLNRSLLQRTLILLVAAFPEMDSDTIAGLSIGARDTCLLLVRERLFGSRLVNNAVCPQCMGRIEWEQDISEMVVETSDSQTAHQYNLERDDYRLCFRLPNSMDMAELEGIDNAQTALTRLLRRCILSADYAGATCGIDQLPESVIQALSRQIEKLDPQAEVRINLTCPDCSHRWDVFFDIAGFLWTEIDEWAERMLRTVHKLASAYGWTEGEVLNLSPVRRQLYLGMVGA
jgi:hypothetical protein